MAAKVNVGVTYGHSHQTRSDPVQRRHRIVPARRF